MTPAAGLAELWIVGPGRMGLALGTAIRDSGGDRNLTFIGRRSEPPAAPGSDPSKFRYASWNDAGNLPSPHTILITVPDAAIPGVAAQLDSLDLSPTVALHTSGAVDSATLATLSARGWETGSLHPLVAAPDPDAGARKLRGAWFGVEGSREAILVARSLVDLLGGRVLLIDSDQKALYHAAAVMSSNHVVALLDVAVRMMSRCGIDSSDAAAALGELASGAATDVAGRGARMALTGPIVRGDVQTVRDHLDRLSGDESRLYSVLAREALRIATARGLTPDVVASIEAILVEELG